jgi:hypothetical protein
MASDSAISAYYAHKNIFITGATGNVKIITKKMSFTETETRS